MTNPTYHHFDTQQDLQLDVNELYQGTPVEETNTSASTSAPGASAAQPTTTKLATAAPSSSQSTFHIPLPFGGGASKNSGWRSLSGVDKAVFLGFMSVVITIFVVWIMFAIVPNDENISKEAKIILAENALDDTLASVVGIKRPVNQTVGPVAPDNPTSFALRPSDFPVNFNRVLRFMAAAGARTPEGESEPVMNFDIISVDFSPDAASWLSDFGRREAEECGASSGGTDVVPSRVLRATTQIWGQSATVSLVIAVTSLSASPRTHLVLRVEGISLSLFAGKLLPADKGVLKDINLDSAATVLLSTSNLLFIDRQIVEGINFRLTITRQSDFDNGYMEEIFRYVDGSPSVFFNGYFELPSTDLAAMIVAGLDSVDEFKAVYEEYIEDITFSFDVSVDEVSIKVANSAIQMDDLVIAVDGLGTDEKPEFHVSSSFDGSFKNGRDRLGVDLCGNWNPDEGLELRGTAVDIHFPSVEKFIDVHSLEAVATFDPDGKVGLKLDHLVLEGSATIPVLNNATLDVEAFVTAGAYGIVAKSQIRGMSISDIACVIAKKCDGELGLIGDLKIKASKWVLSVGSDDVSTGDITVRKGISLLAKVEFNVPDSLQDVIDILGVTDFDANIGLRLPGNDVEELEVLAFLENVSPLAEDGSVLGRENDSPFVFETLGFTGRPFDASFTIFATGSIRYGDSEVLVTLEGGVSGKSVILSGSMDGTLKNIAGIPGLDIGDLGVTVGLGPPSKVNAIGFSGSMKFGDSSIAIDLFGSTIDPKFYVVAEVENFSIGELVRFLVESALRKSGKEVPDALSVISKLSIFRIDTLSIQIASEDMTIGDKQVARGIDLEGKVSIMFITLDFAARSVEKQYTLFGQKMNLTDVEISMTASTEKLGSAIDAVEDILDDIQKVIDDIIDIFTCIPGTDVCAPIKDSDKSWLTDRMREAARSIFKVRTFELLDDFSLLDNTLGLISTPKINLEVELAGQTFSLSELVPLELLGNPSAMVKHYLDLIFSFRSKGRLVEDALKSVCNTHLRNSKMCVPLVNKCLADVIPAC